MQTYKGLNILISESIGYDYVQKYTCKIKCINKFLSRFGMKNVNNRKTLIYGDKIIMNTPTYKLLKDKFEFKEELKWMKY